MAKLTVLALNCTLKRTAEGVESSTDRLLSECLEAFEKEGVKGELVRVADLDIPAGVETGPLSDTDDWPAVRARILAADVLIVGTPIWVGQPSSLAKRVLERMDAFLEEKDELGRMPSYGKIGLVAVVGNEDGAHHCSALLYQALNDLGFTLPPNAVTYFVGEVMSSAEYKRVRKTPEVVAEMTTMMVKNAVHLARLLKKSPFPSPQ